MIRKVITLMAAGTLACGGLIYLQAQPGDPNCAGPGGPHHMMGNPLEHLSSALDLTADQKAKLQPIIDAAKPQIEAIHREAMEKMRTVMENAGTQIRPLLTAQQQQKFDAMKQAHENMRKAMQDLHDAEKK
jgi:Spy/CpxP family protein refolding chaperone